MTASGDLLRVAVVGPCSAGKSTVIPLIKAAGFEARHPAQEHSLVQNMWQRISRPDVLIFLDVSYTAARQRRPYIDGGPQRLAEQHRRLAHAREHCDFYLDTSELAPHEVAEAVLDFLQAWREERHEAQTG